MDNNPGLEESTFKIKVTKSSFGNLGEQNFKVLSELKIITEDVLLLSTEDFSKTYSTVKGAKTAKSKLKLDKATIEPFQSQCYEYELEKI
jgi:ribosomal protein L33